MTTYITTNELAERLHYHPRYINQSLKDSVLIEGKHYIRPFGGRTVLYIWEAIEDEMARYSRLANTGIPMSNGGALLWLEFERGKKEATFFLISATKENAAVNRHYCRIRLPIEKN